MSETWIYYRARPSVYAYIKLCTRLLDHSHHVPLTAQERELILLYTRKLIEQFCDAPSLTYHHTFSFIGACRVWNRTP